jgi:hypothetical protein
MIAWACEGSEHAIKEDSMPKDFIVFTKNELMLAILAIRERYGIEDSIAHDTGVIYEILVGSGRVLDEQVDANAPPVAESP